MSEPIAAFIACLPDIQGAVKISGEGDGRVQFDVPESELPEVIKLVAFGKGRALRITVEAVE